VSNGSQAVFLSYASQDAEAAQKICDALRAAAIEVSFDKSELRGGNAWDRRIRQQIHDCRLFIAIISAHTEARDEGYFRRKWRLAVERAGDMAEDKAFVERVRRLLSPGQPDTPKNAHPSSDPTAVAMPAAGSRISDPCRRAVLVTLAALMVMVAMPLRSLRR